MTTTYSFLRAAALSVATLAVAGSLYVLPVAAQTFYYVDTTGDMEATEADTADQALMMATDIAYDSGVITESAYRALMGDDTMTMAMVEDDMEMTSQAMIDATNDGDMERYAYVMMNDEMGYVTANTPEEALMMATDIKYNSGVILAEEL